MVERVITIALVVVFRWIKDMPTLGGFSRHRFLRNAFALVLSSAIAGFATAPFAAYHFNQIAHFGIVANTLSLPLMGMVIMPFAIIAAILAPFGLDWMGFWVMEQGINWILMVAHWVGGFENAVSLVPQAPSAALPLIVSACLLAVLLRGYARLVALPGVRTVFDTRELPREIVDLVVMRQDSFRASWPEAQTLADAWFARLQDNVAGGNAAGLNGYRNCDHLLGLDRVGLSDREGTHRFLTSGHFQLIMLKAKTFVEGLSYGSTSTEPLGTVGIRMADGLILGDPSQIRIEVAVEHLLSSETP